MNIFASTYYMNRRIFKSINCESNQKFYGCGHKNTNNILANLLLKFEKYYSNTTVSMSLLS